MTQIKENIFIAGAETMLGRYLSAELAAASSPEDPTLFICLGDDEEEDAREHVHDSVERLLAERAVASVLRIVYASSYRVYSPDAGECVDESRPTFARSENGKWRARTELMLEKWCEARGVTLTIARVALMFGTGVDGWLLKLFNRVVRGHYVHLRDNDAAISLVTALDAAKAMVRLAGLPGIYNVSDGRAHKWIDVVEAMTANAGAQKRMSHLPVAWAHVIYRFCRWIPIVQECLSPEALEPFSLTLVLDNSKLRAATDMEFFDTVEVISRRSKTYPYETR